MLDKWWDTLAEADLKWVNLILVNDTWSAFCLRPHKPDDAKQKTRRWLADSFRKRVRYRLRQLVGQESVLGRSAGRAHPVAGEVLEPRAWRDPVGGVARGRVVGVAAHPAGPG